MRKLALLLLLIASLRAQDELGRYIVELQEPSVLAARLEEEQLQAHPQSSQRSSPREVLEPTRGHQQALRDTHANRPLNPRLPSSEGIRQADQIRRNRVLAQQERVIEQLFPRYVRIRGRVDTVANALIVETNHPETLENLPFVKSVRRVRTYRLALDRALSVLGIPQAWARVGGKDVAGAGTKIAIFDTGIDPYHAAFQDPSLQTPEGYPKFTTEGDRAVTSNKIIVARSYDGTSASDRQGHGTGVAAAAAGVVHLGNRPDMGGVAPKAFLGAYRVSEGAEDRITDDALLRALDDAVKDGMDVINMSLSGPALGPVEENVLTAAIQRAIAAGILVVVASGNEGPDPLTVGDLGAIPQVITVGSTRSNWVVATPSVTSPNQRFLATPASNSENAEPVSGRMVDVATLDRTGLACGGFPPASLEGRIAFILRGECTFEEKLNNVQAAGAIAAVVYNNVGANAENPSGRVIMAVNAATLRALMVSRADGLTLKAQIATEPEIVYSLNFRTSTPDDPGVLSSFSSRGPTLEHHVKPDLVAVGSNIWTATNGTRPGDPSTSSYVLTSGTSLATPLVAGAAAVLKQARPGLTTAQYRSLLVNTAEPFPTARPLTSVQLSGGGRLDLNAALVSNTTAEPVSITFGEFNRQSPQVSRSLTLTNLSSEPSELTLSIDSEDTLRPALATASLKLGPKESAQVTLVWSHENPAPGEYQGFVLVANDQGQRIRIPYWLGVRSQEAKQISVFYIVERSLRTSGSARILFRVLDVANLPVNASPEVTVVSGGGRVTNTARIANSGLAFISDVQFGPEPGVNVFKIKAGDVEKEVRINITR
ncbi:MAG: S8 family serine peptidase [Bryobacteraceae bacterium]|nr:S8 family serine peptidase [Bryobacteraceae bacterium]MDW8377272.1 S8 family serine peptidase [Bryobacterales bacterium]